MQIGCIVHMVPDWHKLQLRLLVLGSHSLSDQVEPELPFDLFTSTEPLFPQEMGREETRLAGVLHSLRIRARPVVVSWSDQKF